MNTAVSALGANQAMIGVTSNNIANVNTEGYVKRSLQLETRTASNMAGGIAIGNGVQVSDIVRQTSTFLERLAREAGGTYQSTLTQDQFLQRIQSYFSFDGETTTIGSSLTAFSNAIGDLSANPANIELRMNVISRAQDLASSVRNTYNSLAQMQDEADQRMVPEIQTINSLTAEIAKLNGEIRSNESTGHAAPDERDKRDQLLKKLSEKMSFSVLELPNGEVNVTLPNGFALVNGVTSRNLSLSKSLSGVPADQIPPSLSGGRLNYIVYDYSNGLGTGQVDLTGLIAQGGGSLGGLLAIRGVNPPLSAAPPPAATAFSGSGVLVDVASRVEAFARQMLLDINAVYLGDAPALTHTVTPTGDLDDNPPAAFGLFTIDEGLTAASGYPEASDLVASGFDTFASRLKVTFTEPRQVAAARDATVVVPYDFAQGDGRNMEALSAMLDLSRTFTLGTGYSFTGTFTESYDEMVANIGNQKSNALVNLNVAEAQANTAEARRDEVSGVSLDEEFTNLIKFQRGYEASARLIKIADQLLQEVVSLI